MSKMFVIVVDDDNYMTFFPPDHGCWVGDYSISPSFGAAHICSTKKEALVTINMAKQFSPWLRDKKFKVKRILLKEVK